MNDLSELGKLVAEQMENVERDFEGREEDFEYKGSISILVYADKHQDKIGIRQRTSMCNTCSLRALTFAIGQFSDQMPCIGEDSQEHDTAD